MPFFCIYEMKIQEVFIMGCFIVPAAEAVITTVATKMVKSNEKEESVKVSFADGTLEEATKIKFSTKLGWLNKMLWGGFFLSVVYGRKICKRSKGILCKGCISTAV